MPADGVADDIQLSPYGLRGASSQQAEAQLMGGAVQIVANFARSRTLGFVARSVLPPV